MVSPKSPASENCDPKFGIIAHSRLRSASAPAASVLHESNHNIAQDRLELPIAPSTVCKDTIDPSGDEENGTHCQGRRGFGTRVQSLVQAFEHMISLGDTGSQRKIGEQPCQPPKTCRVEEELDSDVEGEKATHSVCSEESWRKETDEKDENEKSAYHDGDSSSTSGSDVLYPKTARVTSLQPFSLRTQMRGAKKEYEFRKKLEKMWEEDNKLRVPMAQGLPWTTDEPQVVPKPPPRENTVPMDIRLYTENRSVRRAQFDQYITEKLMYIEQEREERRRLQELAEQEEIKRLRKEMIPRAQMMPFFDRPFIPQRSSKPLTIPKEPTFHYSQDPKRGKGCMAS